MYCSELWKDRLKIQSILVPPYEEDVETIQSFVPEDCDETQVSLEMWVFKTGQVMNT